MRYQKQVFQGDVHEARISSIGLIKHKCVLNHLLWLSFGMIIPLPKTRETSSSWHYQVIGVLTCARAHKHLLWNRPWRMKMWQDVNNIDGAKGSHVPMYQSCYARQQEIVQEELNTRDSIDQRRHIDIVFVQPNPNPSLLLMLASKRATCTVKRA